MRRQSQRVFSLAFLLAVLATGSAFTPLGPLKNFAPDPWQGAGYTGLPSGIGYDLPGDIGGPMTPLEFYRWNIPVITYAFDSSFLRYFGTNGVKAVEDAIAILNALPAASDMTPTLSEFPLDARGQNHTAAALELLDLKSTTLGILLEEMGLANPERFVWGLRGRVGPPFANYLVIPMNYDPVTLRISRYVNGVLYNYAIYEPLGPIGLEWASALEWYQLDPLFVPYSSIAGGLGNNDFQLGTTPNSRIAAGLTFGDFFRGLTRDDAGAFRFLLSPNNIVMETLLPGVSVGGRATTTSSSGQQTSNSGSPWIPFLNVTNFVGVTNPPPVTTTNTNNVVSTAALRPGINKITFQRVNYDSLLGTTFTPITQRYQDRILNANGSVTTRSATRQIIQPDITFSVDDLGVTGAIPFIWARTVTDGWANNSALNSVFSNLLGGPGVITPPMNITFSDLVPSFFHIGPLLNEGEHFFSTGLWGSFDGTDTPPTIYPVFVHPLAPDLSLEFISNTILGRN